MLRGLSFGKRAPESVIPLADIPTFKQFAAKEKEIADVAAKAQKKTKASYTPFVDKIRLFRGDITRLQVDAIVNAANTSLWAGGGVCGAIHHAAGTELERECSKIGHCATGQTVITKGYKLPAKHVLHAVGPTRTDDKALASCYATCLERCVENELRSVAFCCISTGIYGFPNDRACNVALTTVRNWLDHDKERAAKIDAIIFCTFLAEDYKLYISNIPLLFPLEPTTAAAAASEEPEPASAVSAVAAAVEAPKSPVGETEATDMEEKKPFAVNSPSAPHSPSPPPPPPPGESDSFAPAAVDESKSSEPGSTGLPLPSSSPASSSDFAPTQPGESEKDTSAPMQTEPEGESVPPAP